MPNSPTASEAQRIGFALGVKLSSFSYWKIGGVADYFIEPRNAEALVDSLRFCVREKVPYVVIGQGTNVLFDDKGFRGAVIRIGSALSNYKWKNQNTLYAESGSWMPLLAVRVGRLGYADLDHTVGIPASLGGLVYMNGGSLRNNLDRNIKSVVVVDRSGSTCELSHEECGFGYRTSRFQKTGEIILGATFSFEERNTYQTIRRNMLSILGSRRSKFPRKIPNCGSVFKASEKLYDEYGPPGKIIEDLGFKGMKIGGIEVSQQHANFLINVDSGSSEDVLACVKKINAAVFEQRGSYLKPEFRYLDPYSGFREFEPCT